MKNLHKESLRNLLTKLEILWWCIRNHAEFKELVVYGETVSGYSKSSIKFEIPNSSHKHASIILVNMLRTSKEYFVILTRSFSEIVFNIEFFNELNTALNRNVKISFIIVEPYKYNGFNDSNAKDELNLLIKKIESFKDNKNFHLESRKLEQVEINVTEQKNLAVADWRMYWHQYNTKMNLAKANFNDPKFVEKLILDYKIEI